MATLVLPPASCSTPAKVFLEPLEMLKVIGFTSAEMVTPVTLKVTVRTAGVAGPWVVT